MERIAPALFCLFLWWFGTAVVLRLDTSSEQTNSKRIWLVTAFGILALATLFWVRNLETIAAAYTGFFCALLVWAWLEYMHYSGVLIGPREKVCPAQAKGLRRFVYAVHAMLYHELAMAAMAVLLLLLLRGSENTVALYTYCVLWLMRVSAELNVYFGVANLPEHWLPQRLQYLMSYRRTKSWSGFFPVSVGVATVVCTGLFLRMPEYAVDAFSNTAMMLTASLLLLAIVEHWLLVLPININGLWAWAHKREACEQ